MGQTQSNTLEATHCVPLGLYPNCPWQSKQRVIKKLIMEKKLAPIFKGNDSSSEELDECPICFLVSVM